MALLFFPKTASFNVIKYKLCCQYSSVKCTGECQQHFSYLPCLHGVVVLVFAFNEGFCSYFVGCLLTSSVDHPWSVDHKLSNITLDLGNKIFC